MGIIKEPKGPERRNDGEIKLYGDSDGIDRIKFKGYYVSDGSKYDAIVEFRRKNKVIKVMGLNKKFEGLDMLMMVETEGEDIKENGVQKRLRQLGGSAYGTVDIGESYPSVKKKWSPLL